MKAIGLIFIFTILLPVAGQNGWVIYTGENGEFELSFPKQPTVQYLGANYGTLGGTIVSYTPIDSIGSSNQYVLMVSEYPPDTINSRLDVNIQKVILRIKASAMIGMIGKVISEEYVMLNEFVGISMVGEILKPPSAAHGLIYIKAFLVNNKVYLMMVTCKAEGKGNPLINQFFDSFKIKS